MKSERSKWTYMVGCSCQLKYQDLGKQPSFLSEVKEVKQLDPKMAAKLQCKWTLSISRALLSYDSSHYVKYEGKFSVER